jgi:hypothetical protein
LSRKRVLRLLFAAAVWDERVAVGVEALARVAKVEWDGVVGVGEKREGVEALR